MIVVEYVLEDLMLEINIFLLLICLGDEASLEVVFDFEDVAVIIFWYDEVFEFIGEGVVIVVMFDCGGLVFYFVVVENVCVVDMASIEIEVEIFEVAIIGGDIFICIGDFVMLEVVGCDNCIYEWMLEDWLINFDVVIMDVELLCLFIYQVIVIGEVCWDILMIIVDVGICECCEVDKVFIVDVFILNGDQNNDMICV